MFPSEYLRVKYLLSKSFCQDKLTLRLYADNLLWPTLKMSSRQTTSAFYYETNNYQLMRRVGMAVSYRFGEMKTQIRKAQRSIRNDDNMSSGGQNNGAGGAQDGAN